MEVAQDKLLEAFEEFEEDLEVEAILEKVKAELVLDSSVTAFGVEVKAEGAAQTGSSGNPDSTSHPLPPACATLNTPAMVCVVITVEALSI